MIEEVGVLKERNVFRHIRMSIMNANTIRIAFIDYYLYLTKS